MVFAACDGDDDGGDETDTGADSGMDDTGMDDTGTDDSGTDDSGGDDSGDTAVDTGTEGRVDLEWPVDERGPYQVGMQEHSVTYSLPPDDTERTLRVFVWYPTDVESGTNPQGSLLPDVGPQMEVWLNAEPRPPAVEDGYPVLAYSHGHRAWGTNAYQLMRHFASHGWVVVSPSHTENTFSDPDPSPGYILYARPMDITQSIDLLDTLTDDFPGDILTDQVVLTGHSRGGSTTWIAGGASFDEPSVREQCMVEETNVGMCTEEEIAVYISDLSDDRIVGIVPMDGGPRQDWMGTSWVGDVEIPVMQMAANDNQRDTYEPFSNAGGSIAWAALDGACHEAFTFGSSTDLGGCEATISDQDGFYITNTYAMAFARWVLLGDDGESTIAILDGTTEVHGDVRYQQTLFE